MESVTELTQAEESQTSPSGIYRAVALILEGIAVHAPAGNAFDRSTFQESIRRQSVELTRGGISGDQTMMAAGAVIQSIATYGRSIEQYNRTRAAELEGIISLLAEAMKRTCRASETAVAGIRGVEETLAGVCEVEDLRGVRTRLRDCLAAVRAEGERQEQNSLHAREAVEAMSNSAVFQEMILRSANDHGAEFDDVTGLAGQAAAIRELDRAYETRTPVVAVPFAVERLSAVRLRFGEDAMSQLLFLTGETLRQRLRAEDVLYSWKSDCYLAILKRQVHIELVRREVSRIGGTRIELTLNVGDRVVLVPVTLSWQLLHSRDYADAKGLLQQVCSFAARRRD